MTRPTKCCTRIQRSSTPTRGGMRTCQAGHQEAWADAFCNVMREIYRCIAAGPPYPPLPPMVATFEDGFRANRIVDAILESAADGGAWTRV